MEVVKPVSNQVYVNNLSIELRAFVGTFNIGGARNEEVRTLTPRFWA